MKCCYSTPKAYTVFFSLFLFSGWMTVINVRVRTFVGCNKRETNWRHILEVIANHFDNPFFQCLVCHFVVQHNQNYIGVGHKSIKFVIVYNVTKTHFTSKTDNEKPWNALNDILFNEQVCKYTILLRWKFALFTFHATLTLQDFTRILPNCHEWECFERL